MCVDRREHKPFGRSRWQAVVSLGMHVLVRARVRVHSTYRVRGSAHAQLQQQHARAYAHAGALRS